MKPQRSNILLLTLLVFFFSVQGRLFYWQVIKGPELKTKALSQTYKLQKKLPQRGKIFSKDTYPLVLNENRYQLSIYKPNLTTSAKDAILTVEKTKPEFSDIDKATSQYFLSNENQKWQTFLTQFNKEEKDSLEIPGFSFQEIDKRFYPENIMAKDVLGVVAKNSQGNDVGYGGLEGYYNKQLKGKTGFSWITKDATGKTILTKKTWHSENFDGLDLYTHIDRRVQYHLEQALMEGIQNYSADSGSVAIMDSQSGAIIGMASMTATTSAAPAIVKNPIIADLYEPGSIFKPLVLAMALDSDSINENFICNQCNRPRTIGQYSINNWNLETYPDSDIYQIIKNSDNIGMSFIINRLGLENFLSYYQKLGLNQKTGVDLQGESKPPMKKYWPEIDLATASFGQGFAITQINMLQSFNALANNGTLVRPKVVEKMNNNGKIVNNKIKPPTAVFSKKTTDLVKDILKYSVENSTVAQFKPKNLEVCAKSGTAQVAVQGTYTDSSTIASYIGFSPCYSPKFTMIVTINNPKTSQWGSSTAAPIWFELASVFNNLL